MPGPCILVTGASGQQGGAVARSLLRCEQPIRVMCRSLDRVAHLEEMGAEGMIGDLTDKESIEDALDGIQMAFLVTSWFESGLDAEVEQAINFIKKAKKAKLQHLIYASVGGGDQRTGIPFFETKDKVETFLKNSKIPCTIIRPVFFMENFGASWFLPQIQQGKIALPMSPTVPLQMVSLDVIGNLVAKAFLQPGEFVNKTITLASDELTFPEIAQKISAASHKQVTYEEISDEAAAQIVGADFTKMYRWFSNVGFGVNIEGLQKLGVHLTTFDEYLTRASWLQRSALA